MSTELTLYESLGSHELALKVAYSPELMRHLRERATSNTSPSAAAPISASMSDSKTEFPPMEFSEDYLKLGGEVSNRRAVQAGYRLAAVLVELVKE